MNKGHIDKEIDLLIMHGGEFVKSKHGKIEKFEVAGEMAMITWFRQITNSGVIVEYNPKYIEVIQYKGTTNE